MLLLHFPGEAVIDLCNNDLSGAVLNYLVSVPLLEEIKLDGNGFTGLLLSFPGLTSLRTLSLGDNYFAGSLPTEWADHSSTLTSIHVQNNPNVWGTIPVHYASLENLGMSSSMLLAKEHLQWTTIS